MNPHEVCHRHIDLPDELFIILCSRSIGHFIAVGAVLQFRTEAVMVISNLLGRVVRSVPILGVVDADRHLLRIEKIKIIVSGITESFLYRASCIQVIQNLILYAFKFCIRTVVQVIHERTVAAVCCIPARSCHRIAVILCCQIMVSRRRIEESHIKIAGGSWNSGLLLKTIGCNLISCHTLPAVIPFLPAVIPFPDKVVAVAIAFRIPCRYVVEVCLPIILA